MLHKEERRAVFLHCRDHAVAVCCGRALKFTELAADLFQQKETRCPSSRRCLRGEVRAHLATCPAVRRRASSS